MFSASQRENGYRKRFKHKVDSVILSSVPDQKQKIFSLFLIS
ncbi:hypothetical protein LEP1GSC170_3295 [Leptospira interrogans serovar Bataviae str. HAI135]|nr:hypothetical protein LEP1GSC170_3295 [Leptospira interrogans serovar Bataviae str. HAI135]